VVEDLDATIRAYWETAGIGPWAVWTPKLTSTRVRGVETPFSMKLAMACTECFMWEVVQPLEGPSHYREHLDRHGEGVHHVLVVTGNHAYEEMLAEEEGWEGCLSVPGLRGVVPRFSNIRYTGFDPYGDPIDRTASGFHARVVQHEVDHLHGILYPMRIRDFSRFGFTEVMFPDRDPQADD